MKHWVVSLWLMVAMTTAWGAAVLDIVATTSSMGVLARTVGGPQASVRELAQPDRDVHMLQARPSMMAALRDAHLVVAVGAELEIGWLPAALAGAANPDILPGRSGYFEAAAQVPLLDAGQSANRAGGDVHPAGNPHVSLDPARMARIAIALAARLAQLDPAHADAYHARAQQFADTVDDKLPQWRQTVAGAGGAVLHHKDGAYVLDALGLPLLGTLEPLPGVAPTATHLKTLAAHLAGKRGVIVRTPYQPPSGAETFSRLTGWPVAVLSIDPPTNADMQGYLDLIGQWVEALATAK